MNKNTFWKNWLIVVSLIIVVYGLGLAFFGQSTLFNLLLNNQINEVFWSSTQPPVEFIKFQQFNLGVLGSVVAGWGIIMAFIFYHTFDNRQKWVWNAVMLGLIVWYIPDTIISIVHFAYSNAIMNTLLFVLLTIPLIIKKKEFVN